MTHGKEFWSGVDSRYRGTHHPRPIYEFCHFAKRIAVFHFLFYHVATVLRIASHTVANADEVDASLDEFAAHLVNGTVGVGHQED